MMRNHRCLFVTSVCLVLFLFSPQELFPYELAKRGRSFTLRNGLRLLLVESHLSPTISLHIRHRAVIRESPPLSGGTEN